MLGRLNHVAIAVKDAEKVAALEMGRRLKYFPAMFKGLRLLESRPGEYMRKLINSQSYRAATGTVFGQEVPEPARQAMLAIFEAIGARSELSDRFRERLASALYR